jgi:hypothetical protein
VIITTVCTGNNARHQWQTELLHHSWKTAGIKGEFVRLVACKADEHVPESHGVRMLRAMPWNPHPYTQDQYPPYNIPASILEWLFTERVDATVLLVEPETILLSGEISEVLPGEARANKWKALPNKGSGPFGLIHAFHNVHTFCINRELTLPEIQFPVLIHSSDLRKIAARWLELTSLIRSSVEQKESAEAWRVAYAIAAAEYRIAHTEEPLAADLSDSSLDHQFLNYRGRVRGKAAKTVWDSNNYSAWEPCDAGNARVGAGRAFLEYLQSFVSSREAGSHLGNLIPIRVEGVRDATVIDQVILDIPGRADGLSLNTSAGAIWKLIDNESSMLDIAHKLESRFDMPKGTLWPDVEATAVHLQASGAILIRSATAS